MIARPTTTSRRKFVLGTLGAAGSPVTLEIWPEMFHVFQARYPMLSQAREAIDRLGQWAAAHAGR